MKLSELLLLILVGTIATGGLLVGCPQYNIYTKKLNGEAQLREAEYTKRIGIETSKAKNEAAVLEANAEIQIAKGKAQAEVERAKGVATANQIIGNSLQNNEEYLRYLFIQQLGNNNNDVIYLPTEGLLPITESTRLNTTQQTK